jgi:manganese-transporting P-type ATPase
LQATLMGVISAAMFFVLSNTKPLGRLSAQRPHPNIFCAYLFLSLLGQFLVHLAFLAGMYHVAKSGMSAVRTPSI